MADHFNHSRSADKRTDKRTAPAAAISSKPAPDAPNAERSLAGISLVKGHERWHFRWNAGDEAALINRIAELARDPEVPFDWYDAAVVCKHIAQPFARP
jgi:hypothetical protein